MDHTAKEIDAQRIITDAQRCVKCAMCLPHCPTYQFHQDENQSPRGRIALMEAVAQGQLDFSKPLQHALDSCLACGACENTCPAQVPYLDILHRTRANHPTQPAKKLRWLFKLIESPKRQRWLSRLLMLYRYSGLRYLLKPQWLGLAILKYQTPHRLKSDKQPTVMLFTGCLGSLLENDTLHASIKLLTAAGFSTQLSPVGQCCGGLHAQAGQTYTSPTFDNALPIITISNGCQRQLRRDGYDSQDILDFLAKHADKLDFSASHAQVLVHTNCAQTSLNGLKILLAKVPQLQVTWLQHRHCCGGAGSYPLTNPADAHALREQLLNQLADAHYDYFLTTNPGCRNQLQPLLDYPVIHPASLLANLLKK